MLKVDLFSSVGLNDFVKYKIILCCAQDTSLKHYDHGFESRLGMDVYPRFLVRIQCIPTALQTGTI